MQGPIWKLPILRDVRPFRQGLLEALGSAVSVGLIFSTVFVFADLRPSSDLLRDAAQIGATLLVAYALVSASIVKAARFEPGVDRQFRIGALSGFGGWGFAAVFVLLGLSERSSSPHWSWLDQALLGWAAVALLMLGVAVILQAEIADSWSSRPSDE